MPALIMDGQYLVKEKIIYSNYGQCIALQNLYVQRKKSAAIHRGFCLLKQSFCQCDTSRVFASELIKSIF